MSSHLARHRAEMEKQAYPAVEHFIQHHPEYAIEADQSGNQSVTNYVIFGRRGEQRVIFKYFCQDERKEREVYALHHFAETRLVPQLLEDYDNRLIVQSHIPGGGLPQPCEPEFNTIDPHLTGITLGRATAKLLSVPLSAQAAQAYENSFYEGLRLENYFREILDASWQIHKNVESYRTPLFAQSLETVEANLPYILAQKRLLYHQDALNMHFAESRFTGFFDLEMCRVGTEAMQVGSLWYVFAVCHNWKDFVRGYSEVAGRKLDEHDLAAGRAFAQFLVWRYISHYGRWNGEIPEQSERGQVEKDAAQYKKSIELNNQVGD